MIFSLTSQENLPSIRHRKFLFFVVPFLVQFSVALVFEEFPLEALGVGVSMSDTPQVSKPGGRLPPASRKLSLRSKNTKIKTLRDPGGRLAQSWEFGARLQVHRNHCSPQPVPSSSHFSSFLMLEHQVVGQCSGQRSPRDGDANCPRGPRASEKAGLCAVWREPGRS